MSSRSTDDDTKVKVEREEESTPAKCAKTESEGGDSGEVRYLRYKVQHLDYQLANSQRTVRRLGLALRPPLSAGAKCTNDVKDPLITVDLPDAVLAGDHITFDVIDCKGSITQFAVHVPPLQSNGCRTDKISVTLKGVTLSPPWVLTTPMRHIRFSHPTRPSIC